MYRKRLIVGSLVLGLSVAALIGIIPSSASATPAGYTFTPIAFLGDLAPGPEGGTFINDFEPNGLNNHGDVLFGADMTTGGEGVFLLSKGQISQIARSFANAPGGGVFDSLFLGPTSLNDEGDVGFVFPLSPFSLPVGVNSSVYRFSHITHTATPVVIPGVTPAPGGGVFAGGAFGYSLNNRGDLSFTGIVPTDKGIHLPGEPYIGLGIGIFKAGKKGQISPAVVPGDPAPGGGTFDFASGPWINDGGDVAFVAHIAGEECPIEGFPPQAVIIACLGSAYVKKAATGEIQSIVHAGDPAPRGGVYRQVFFPQMNNRGDLVFTGDLTPPPGAQHVRGVYLHSGGVIIAVARPGDPLPGGGKLVNASIIGGNLHVNNPGEVVFNAVLDTDVNGDSIPDTGLYVWSHGSLHLVARTGTVLPDVGTVNRLVLGVTAIPPPSDFGPNSGAINNDRGQVLFGATLEDGRGVLLVATPSS